MPTNKVVYGNTTLIDLTSDTAIQSDVASGKSFHLKDGSKVNGTAELTRATYSNGNVTLSKGFPVQAGQGGLDVQQLNVSANGTYTAPSGVAYSPIVVNVPIPTSKKIQYSPVVGRIANTTSYTTTGSEITIEESGSYKCTWIHYAYASSSSYYLSRLYKGNTAIGSTHQCPAYNGTSGWVAEESSLQLNAGDVISVRARARSGTSYWTVAGMLVVEKL